MIDPRFADTVFVIEATSCEQQMLWEANDKTKRLKWEPDSGGLFETIGEVAGRPICIFVFWAKLNGHRVAFWDATSQLVDYVMIETWWAKTCAPRYDGGHRLAATNATNFHHAIHCVEDLGKR